MPACSSVMARPVLPAMLTFVLASILSVVACGNGSTGSPGGPGAVEGEVTVFAASSLTEAFTAMAGAFEAEHPGVNVTLNFAGSTMLRTQLEQGARAGVFASANEQQMDLAVQSGLVAGTPVPFATNRLVVVTPTGSDTVQSLGDLANPGVKLILTLPGVPIGVYSRQSLEKLSGSPGLPADFSSRVLENLVSEEANVRQVLAKIMLDEADAGIVYETDITANVAGRVSTIQVPDEFNVVASYPIAVLSGAPNSGGAAAFVEFVLSDDGQEVLAGFGFGAAP